MSQMSRFLDNECKLDTDDMAELLGELSSSQQRDMLSFLQGVRFANNAITSARKREEMRGYLQGLPLNI